MTAARPVNASDLMKVQTALTSDQIQKFFTATPPAKIKERPAKGGGKWKYVEGSYVTQVLNSLFGFYWSFEILTPMSDALATAQTGTVVVLGRLRVRIDPEKDIWITKEQYGRKEVAFRKDTRDPLDFGNDMKAAATDAKKKCASELGLFADVYSQDDFFEAQIIDDTGRQTKTIPDYEAEIAKLTTSEQILGYMKDMGIEEKRIVSPLVEKRIETINAEKAAKKGAGDARS